MKSIKPVLIVGAGPTGLTAALELSRMDIPVRMIDKANGPADSSRALAVQSRTLELLQQRGVGEPLIREGKKATFASLYGNQKMIGQIDFRHIPSRYNYVLLIPQSDTERLLRNQLQNQGVQVEWHTEYVDHTSASDGPLKVKIRNSEGEQSEFEASFLISAEGAHSQVRMHYDLPFKGKTMGQNYGLGDVHIDGDIPEDQLSIFTSEIGFIGLFPMTGHRFRVMFTDPNLHSKNVPAPTLEELQEVFDKIVNIPCRLYDLVWSSRFGINSRMLDTLQVGQVFFGGDSAHIHSPAGGQGMNTGIQDMINLGWKLAFVLKGWASEDLLDTYQKERIGVIKKLLSTTERITDLFNSTSHTTLWALTTFLPSFLSLEKIQKKGPSMISEVANHYRYSPLTSKGHKLGNLSGGDRLPDVELLVHAKGISRSQENSTLPLYDLLNPSRFTLFLVNHQGYPFPQDWMKRREHILQVLIINPASESDQSTYCQLFGKQPGFVLVRPDSYLAVLGNITNISMAKTYFDQWFSRSFQEGNT